MVRAEVLQGVREMRFEGLLDRHERGELNQEGSGRDAGSVRSGRFGGGATGCAMRGRWDCATGGIGKPSSRRAAVAEIPAPCWGCTRSATRASL